MWALILAVAAVLLLVPAQASARPFRGQEYVGRTAAGDPVHFALSPDRRVLAFSAGSLPGRCPDGGRTSFPAQFGFPAPRVRDGRFRGEGFVDTGTVGSFTGRLLRRGRAAGRVSISDRGDCAGSTSWTARAGGASVGRLAGGPVLTGARLAWVERAGSQLHLRRGRRLVRRLRLERGFRAQRLVSLSGSPGALAVEREQDGDQGSQIYAGRPGGPLTGLGFGCASHPDADGALVVAALPNDRCTFTAGSRWRVVLRDVARGTTATLFDFGGYPPRGPELAKLAGRWVAWIDGEQIVVWDRTALRGPLDRSPAGAYRVPAGGVVDFDLDVDGTLVVVRPTTRFRDDRSYALDAFWPADPRAHRVGTAATPSVQVAAGRKAYVAWQPFGGAALAPLVVGPARAGAHTVVALFPRARSYRVRRAGGFDLDAARVAWAEAASVTRRRATTRGPVRLVAVPVPR